MYAKPINTEKPGFSEKPGFCGARRLQEIMLDHLQAGDCLANWPGGDGLTIEDVLDSYPEAVARGEVPDWQQLLCGHPELDAELHLWLDNAQTVRDAKDSR